MDFSATEKDSGVKLGMLVRLLSGQVFSHFGELWLAWSYGGGITGVWVGDKVPQKLKLLCRHLSKICVLVK